MWLLLAIIHQIRQGTQYTKSMIHIDILLYNMQKCVPTTQICVDDAISTGMQ